MYIKEVEVVNFRNYERQKVNFSEGTNIVYGKNAQGKTNILEAVALFSSGKSHRRVPDKDLINWNADYAKISMEFCSHKVDNKAEIVLSKGKNKFIRLNGEPLRRTSELLGVFKSVIFSPEEMFLISGPPELRRNFIDLLLSSEKPLYYNILKRYSKIIKQKNKLLKNPGGGIIDTLSVWNEELAAAGAKIMMYRIDVTQKLSSAAEKAYSKFTNGREKIEIKYASNVPVNDINEDKIREKIFETLQRKMQSEIAMGICLAGTHRDDFEFYIGGKNAKSYSSQGQQRTAVISLKIAQAEIIKERSGEYPVFLLDDVMSELDGERREYISSEIRGKQVIITCTEKSDAGNGAKYFYVENGTVEEEGREGCIFT